MEERAHGAPEQELVSLTPAGNSGILWNGSGERSPQRFQGQANSHTNHLYCGVSKTSSASCASLAPALAVPEPVAATR